MPITIHKDSHLDHAIPDVVRDYVLAEANAQIDEDLTRRRGPFVTTVYLPAGLPEVPCDLHVDVPEAEVHYARRGERPWPSRLCHRPPRMVHAVTVVAGFNPDDPEAGIVLYTMYGGEPAPKEPCDPALREHERGGALGFWRHAALSVPRVSKLPADGLTDFKAPFLRWWHEQTGEHYGPGLHAEAPPEMHAAAAAFEAGQRTMAPAESVNDRAAAAVARIVHDLEGRVGGDGFWGGISPDIRAEIGGEWTAIVATSIGASEEPSR